MIDKAVRKLVSYGLNCGLVQKEDEIYVQNRLLEDLKISSFSGSDEVFSEVDLEETLKELLDYAVETGVIEDGSFKARKGPESYRRR